jgi:hypothetical protein
MENIKGVLLLKYLKKMPDGTLQGRVCRVCQRYKESFDNIGKKFNTDFPHIRKKMPVFV